MGHVHLKGFSPVCSFMWLFRAHFSVKLLSHKWHVNFLHEEERKPCKRDLHRPRRPQQQRVLALSGAAQARGEPQAGPVMSV